jgi:hypothetical protein
MTLTSGTVVDMTHVSEVADMQDTVPASVISELLSILWEDPAHLPPLGLTA